MTDALAQLTLRRRLYTQMEPSAWRGKGLSPLNFAICLLIQFSVLVCILETEPEVSQGGEVLFSLLEYSLTSIFLVEYCLRLWIVVENPEYPGGVRGRIRYALSFFAIIDLVTILVVALATFGTAPLLLRLFRLIRILRLARLGRFSKAMNRMQYALSTRMPDLLLSTGIAAFILIISSTLLYLVEGDIQPKTFGSIPRAIWWGVVTLTTVGYGDVYPVTLLGKILGSITSLIGIGVIAMPTGILAAAFSDAMEEERKETSGEEV